MVTAEIAERATRKGNRRVLQPVSATDVAPKQGKSLLAKSETWEGDAAQKKGTYGARKQLFFFFFLLLT